MYKQYNINTGNQMNNTKIKNIKYELVNGLRKRKGNEKCLESHLGRTESLGAFEGGNFPLGAMITEY